MDKFAVDLDQVLNDFEYSELTDHYSNTVRNSIDASSSVQQNVTKHSINNVFHSLNEYLNTNVDVPSKTSENNKADNQEAVGDTESCYKITPEGYNESKYIVENDARDNDNLISIKEDNIIKVVTEVPAIINTVTNEIPSEKQARTNKTEIEEGNSIQFLETDNIPVTLPKNPNEISTEENVLIDVSEKLRAESEDIQDATVTNSDIITINESDIQDDKLVDYTNLIEKSDINEKLKNNVDKDVNIVGFETVTDVDEDEIEDLLAELEGVSDLNQQESQIMDTNVKEQQTEVKEKCAQTNLQDDLVKETNSTINEEEKKEENITIEETTLVNPKLSNELETAIPSGTEPLTEESIETESTIDKTKNDALINKIENSSESSVNEEMIKSNSKTQSVIEETLTEETKVESIQCVELQEDLCKTEIINKEKKLERQDSASRPQHLHLKEEDDEKQREINLIGNPGSTPYNNVYVNEEISKKDKDNVSISSASSNSYSDTGSTASTASTEEMRDDHDVVNINNKENPTVTNENVGKDTVELSDNVTSGGDLVEEASELSGREESKDGTSEEATASSNNPEKEWLGKEAPLWIPDSNTASCLHCDMKFTVLKRRHHCRACGLVLCSKCCHLRFKLEYLDAEARVCNKCHNILNKDTNSSSSSDLSPDHGGSPLRRPNPNNPLEYCSTISPLQQVGVTVGNPVPAVMVPVGVLKRKGSNKAKSNKSVMFCDGIRPGSDLTNLDNDFNYNNTKTKKLEKTSTTAGKINRHLPIIDSETNSFIPKSENSLPPLITINKSDITYTDCQNNPTVVEMLKENQLTFALLLNLYVQLKIINMNCCINKMAWCFSTEGLINVGQDEIVIILEYIDEESFVPKDVFYHINQIYNEAVKGTSIKELGISLHNTSNFLDSKNHAGFVYIRPTFQCLENVIKPKEPYLIGILIHRWETPWAKLFPLRLILRLGAEYRYYPSPVISTRHRDSVFVEIGHTIINLLADFRNFTYSLPQINGLTIHMEDKNTTVTIPINRYDQVIKSINNSSDHILAFGGTFSETADSHLVCIQDTQGNENCYSTHAINIQNKPRKVTGASFIVFNGALKSSSGLTAKSNIVEDGLMIQVLPENMQQIRDNLRAMKNHTISCGCINTDSDETVNIVWGENDVNFNLGITSAIDGMPLNGVPSIRVHSGQNYCANGNRIIRWTEVFIIQNDDEGRKNQDPIDISRLSEGIAKAVCDALVNYLDLLVTNNFHKIGIRTNLQVDNVSYCGGSNNMKLPPIYMKSLDNELIPVLHRLTSNNLGENCIILELVFRILNV